MNLTTAQVAEKLSVSKTTVASLARTGQLPTVNKAAAKGKRVHYLFDSKAVMEFRKVYAPRTNGNGHDRRIIVDPRNPPMGLLSTILRRLDAVDDKLEQIVSLWS